MADAASRTFQVKFDLTATSGLRTGQFGRVSVPVAETRALQVPADAVIKRGQMELVFVVRDGRAVLRLVKTGKALNGVVGILSGLEEGERVVVSNVANLTDGQPRSPGRHHRRHPRSPHPWSFDRILNDGDGMVTFRTLQPDPPK